MKRIEDSPLARQVLDMLASGGRMSKHNLAARFGCHENSARRVIKLLREHRCVHVVDWTRAGERGGLTAVIVHGPGEDVPKPSTRGAAAACRRWREKQKGKPKVRKLRSVTPPAVDPLMAVFGGR